MSRALKTLVRLRKFELDELRRELVDLEGRRARLENEIRNLYLESEREKQIASGDVGLTIAFGSYANWVRLRREQLELAITELEPRINEAREKVAEAFERYKAFDLAHQAARKREEAERDRREAIVLDDLGVEMTRRRAAP